MSVQAFLSEVVRDDEYMNKTWELTSVWNASLRRELSQRFPSWKARPPPPPHRPWPLPFPPMVPWPLSGQLGRCCGKRSLPGCVVAFSVLVTQVYGEPYLSWVWVDTGDAAVTSEVVRLSNTVGTPVRSAGKSQKSRPLAL